MNVFEITPDPKPKKWRRGIGTVAYSDSGDLFINSELIGMSPMTAFLCTSADGVSVLASAKKLLVPLEWAISEKPHMREELERFSCMVREATDGK